MTTALYIVTGTSRGLGAAIADQLCTSANQLLCISRRSNSELEKKAGKDNPKVLQWQRDLAEAQPIARDLEQWLTGFNPATLSQVSLINNAGVISRIGPVDESDDADLAQAMRVGLEAPLLLSAAFLRATNGWQLPRRILNISSGLGRRAMAGSASYCAAKAGLDNLSRAMVLDEAGRPNGAHIVSLAPGVIDTDMQIQLRGADAAGFPDQANFIALKEQGRLSSAETAAQQILAFLHAEAFGNEVIADIRQV